MGDCYSPEYEGPLHGKMCVAIGDMQLPAPEGGTYDGIILTGADLVEETQEHSFFDARDGDAQTTLLHSSNWMLGTIELTLEGHDKHKLLRDLQGNNKTFMIHLGNADFTPSAEAPLAGGICSVSPFNGEGGSVGSVFTVESDHPVSGRIECLEAKITPVADLAVSGVVVPTTTTIDVTWTADAGYLTTRPTVREIAGYNVYYKISGSSDDFTKANATLVANPLVSGTNATATYQITGLAANTAYDIHIKGVWYFGLEFDASNSITSSTTI